MSAVDDLTELVEKAAAAERTALASKWKERPDVEKLVARVRKNAEIQRSELTAHVNPDLLSSRWVSLTQDYIDLGAQDELPGQQPAADDVPAGAEVSGGAEVAGGAEMSGGAEVAPAGGATSPVRRLSHAAAAQAERDAVAAVELARLALNDAALAVLQARLARIDAGDDDPDAATVDGHIPLHGRNPVSRHGPALAHGLTGEIKYVLTRKPRSTVKSLAITLAMGLLYLGFIRVFEWDTDKKWLPYLGLWCIGVVMGGSVCVNAMSFDAMRVRAALDSGARLWHLLVIKNLALVCIVTPIGFVICALLGWRAGEIYAFYKACVLMLCMILLWLGVGNILSITLPSRDEPIKKRKESGSLKQFIIAFVVSYFIGYLVNAMLVWRAFAAQELTQRLGSAILPSILILMSSIFMWILLTIVAVALAQQPKVRRLMQKEITDYKANAEMEAFAAEEAEATAAAGTKQPVVGASAG